MIEPAVAGKNAMNPHPVYTNWQLEHSRSAISNRGSKVQQQVDHIKAKTTENNPYIEVEAYTPNRKTMHPVQSDSAPDSVNNAHNNLDVLGTQHMTSRQPAELPFTYSSVRPPVKSRTLSSVLTPTNRSHHLWKS